MSGVRDAPLNRWASDNRAQRWARIDVLQGVTAQGMTRRRQRQRTLRPFPCPGTRLLRADASAVIAHAGCPRARSGPEPIQRQGRANRPAACETRTASGFRSEDPAGNKGSRSSRRIRTRPDPGAPSGSGTIPYCIMQETRLAGGARTRECRWSGRDDSPPRRASRPGDRTRATGPTTDGGRRETPRASAVRARRSPGAHSASPRPATATIPPRGRAPHGLIGRRQRRVRNAAPAAGLEIGAQRISLGAFAYVARARFACFSRPIG